MAAERRHRRGRLALGGRPAVAQEKEVVFGLQCDRTGADADRGHCACAPATRTTSRLVNSKGGIEGYKIKVLEIDNEYKVPPAIEAHERFKKEGAVLEGLYGTPQTAALNKKLEEDKILGTSPGFGTAAAADGKRYPYIFPIAASYWSQGAAAVAFAKKKLGGNLKGKKIAYLFYDNPAGKEPLPSSRICRRAKASSCAPSPCRRRASRWARRCSTSPAASSPISSSRTCSAARRRSRSRSSRARAIRSARWSRFVWGALGGRHQGGRRLWAWPRATTPSSSPASARTSR